MYKYSGHVEKFGFVESIKSWKFKENLCTLDVLIVRICRKIQIRWMCKILKIQWKIEECTNSWKFDGKLCTVDVQVVQICIKIRIRWMYKIVKFNGKLYTNVLIIQIWLKIRTFIKCTKLWNLNGKSKNVSNHEN